MARAGTGLVRMRTPRRRVVSARIAIAMVVASAPMSRRFWPHRDHVK